MANVKLEETENRRRLHIGSIFVDLNESDYQDLIKIFSTPPFPVDFKTTTELTKLEFLAAMAMQGILASGRVLDGPPEYQYIAVSSINYAKTLITELYKLKN